MVTAPFFPSVPSAPALGKGSTFSLVLPCLAARKEKEGSALIGDAACQGASPLRIIVVDDNHYAALMVAMLLKVVGHEVTVRYAAKAALAHSAAAPPDVFLLGIGLPEMDSNALTQCRAPTETTGTLLIALTGYGLERHSTTKHLLNDFIHVLHRPVESASQSRRSRAIKKVVAKRRGEWHREAGCT